MRFLHLPPLALFALTACSEDAGPMDTGYAALIPSDTMILVHLSSFEDFAHELEAINSALKLPEPAPAPKEVSRQFLDALHAEILADHVNLARPVAVAGRPPATGLVPEWTIIVPAEDPEGLTSAIRDRAKGWSATAAQDYVAVSRVRAEQGAPPPLGQAPIAAPGLLSVRVDWGALTRVYQPFLELAWSQLDGFMALAKTDDPETMQQMWADARHALEVCEQIEMTWATRGGEWEVRFDAKARDGETWIEAGTTPDPETLRTLSAWLADEAPMRMLSTQQSTIQDDQLLAALRAELQALVADGRMSVQQMDAWVALREIRLCSSSTEVRTSASAWGTDAQGLHRVEFLPCSEPESALEAWVARLQPIAARAGSGLATAGTIADAPARTFELHAEGKLPFRAEETQTELRFIELSTQGIENFYSMGSDLRLTGVAVPSGLLVFANGDDEWRERETERAIGLARSERKGGESLAILQDASWSAWLALDVQWIVESAYAYNRVQNELPEIQETLRSALVHLGSDELPVEGLFALRPADLHMWLSVPRGDVVRAVQFLTVPR